MKEIKHFAIGQSAKTLALIATLASAIFVIPMLLYLMLLEGDAVQFKFLSVLVIPVFYGILTYLLWAVMFFLYNWVAKRFGGIKFQIEE
ncbi:hypothetical protein [Estrella lausannensis]|uniref:Putative membrane protein n=1 Tax=Estrella lausannensis TaxID=483423 RepID=A0A0H5DRG5_9BACT|nr:hypothetical protein [Estrella lausannensis]CRX39177.1 putative membrane protein [Estrella lausannensis]